MFFYIDPGSMLFTILIGVLSAALYAFRFRAGALSETELRQAIGNRSYSGGDAADNR